MSIEDTLKNAATEAISDAAVKSLSPDAEKDSEYNNIFSPASKKFMLNKSSRPTKNISDSEYYFELTVGKKEKIFFPPGLTVLIGGTGSGKSTFLDKLVINEEGDNPNKLLYNEPIENYFAEGFTLIDGARSILDKLISASKDGSTVFIDSISDDFKTLTGASGKEGVTHQAFQALTAINNFCFVRNIKLVASLNPGYLSEDAYVAVHEAVAGKVAGVVKFAFQKRGSAFVNADVVVDMRTIHNGRFTTTGSLSPLSGGNVLLFSTAADDVIPKKRTSHNISIASTLGARLNAPTITLKEHNE